jgi:hypothetical protein
MSRPSMTPRSIALFRFNPLGVGAGSGSHQRLVSIFGGIRKMISFQSPRRWVGVGLTAHAEGHGANLGQRVSIPSEVGRGRAPHELGGGRREEQALFQSPRGRAGPSGKPCSTPSCLVSIPSEVGRGRADPSGKPCSTPSCLVSIPSEVGRGWARRTRCVTASPRTCCLFVSIPSEVGRGRALNLLSCHVPERSPCFNPLGGGAGSGSCGRCNDWPDMSLGSGFPCPPENGTKLGSLSLATGPPEQRKRREKNRLGQVVTGTRNRVNQGYEIRQSKKRRARPPRSGTGTRQGARRKPVTRRGPVHSPRIETGQGRRCQRA